MKWYIDRFVDINEQVKIEDQGPQNLVYFWSINTLRGRGEIGIWLTD